MLSSFWKFNDRLSVVSRYESRLESQLQNYRVIRNRNINLLSLLKFLARCKLKLGDLSPYKNVT